MNQFEFLEKRIKDEKEELKSRKRWAKALADEYCKVRTQKSEVMKKQVMKQYKIACIMVKHQEKIVEELKMMLKECREVK